MDNSVLNLLVTRLRATIEGNRVADVAPARDGITICFTSTGLFLSCHRQVPALFTGEIRTDQRSAYATFAGRLRAFLEGMTLEAIHKDASDRIIQLRFASDKNERYSLTYVAIPRRTELTLLDDQGVVLVGTEEKAGVLYSPPSPPTGEIDLFDSDDDTLASAVGRSLTAEDPERDFLSTFRGSDPMLAKEVAGRAREGTESVIQFLRSLIHLEFRSVLRRLDPGDDRSLQIVPGIYRFAPGELLEEFDDPNEAASRFYRLRLRAEAISELRGEVDSALKRRQRQIKRLESNLRKDIRRAEEEVAFGARGDLILANIGSIPKGAGAIEVEDIHKGDGSKITIELDPARSPPANAERYYRRARRARRSLANLESRLAELDREIREVEEFREDLNKSTEDLRGLRRLHKEIISRGWLTQRQQKKLKIKPPPGRRFVSSDGLEIVVGRNNRDNEVVTFEVGRDNDFWFHVAGYSGSHVIVRNTKRLKELPPATQEEAAALAAYYSRARQSSNVQVHWTIRRFLKKVKGGEPGKVLISNYRSTIAQPEIPTAVRKK